MPVQSAELRRLRPSLVFNKADGEDAISVVQAAPAPQAFDGSR